MLNAVHLLELAVLIVLQQLIEIKRIVMSFEPKLASVENHHNEDEFCKFIARPFIFKVEELENAVDQQVELVLSVGDEVSTRKHTQVLEQVQAHLHELLVELVLNGLCYFSVVDLTVSICRLLNLRLGMSYQTPHVLEDLRELLDKSPFVHDLDDFQ